MARLPDTQGMAARIIVDGGSDTRWNQSLALTGARLDVVGAAGAPMTADQLAQALQHSDVAAVVYFVGGGSRLTEQDVLAAAHARSVPVIFDAAAQLPPVHNLWAFTGMG